MLSALLEGEDASTVAPPAPLSAQEAALAAAGADQLVAELHAAARASRSGGPGDGATGSGGGNGGRNGNDSSERWASSLELLRPQLTALAPDRLADLAWAAARLGLRPGAGWLAALAGAARAKLALKSFHGYTFATLLPALADLLGSSSGSGSGSGSSSGGGSRASGSPVIDAAWLSDCLEVMAAKSGAMYPRELASAAAALPALLRLLPGGVEGSSGGGSGVSAEAEALLAGSGWPAAFFAASGARLDKFEPITLARALHAVAQLAAAAPAAAPAAAAPPAEWLARAMRRLEAAADARALRPAEVAMALQALALLPRGAAQNRQAAADSLAHDDEEAIDEEEAATASGDGAAPRVERQALLAALARALAADADRYGPAQLAPALLALARAGGRADWLWLRRVLPAAQALLPRCGARDVAALRITPLDGARRPPPRLRPAPAPCALRLRPAPAPACRRRSGGRAAPGAQPLWVQPGACPVVPRACLPLLHPPQGLWTTAGGPGTASPCMMPRCAQLGAGERAGGCASRALPGAADALSCQCGRPPPQRCRALSSPFPSTQHANLAVQARSI